ncbi:PEPxxWA-CTERM sorting domain-containing protein [Sphingomonas sp. A2-49]|uniref:PEPxxWA-CTERM sorting domain-containing protein n=1 Tax=Sphingomonas sp. A2-49 TaxID=1391375 RepID=UPI0021D0B5F2|nr:PEPxxWA-CTERM sorting domain-containing protein [Sphingomonas sp. A2-49]MCU6455496.1 PEPxxWA-CTERM sorting domain-containing protein [Sphingomonas sp. A2-49]
MTNRTLYAAALAISALYSGSSNAEIVQSRYQFNASDIRGGYNSPVQSSPVSSASGFYEVRFDTVTGDSSLIDASIVFDNGFTFYKNDLDHVAVERVPFAFYFGGSIAGVPGFNMDGSNTDFYSYIRYDEQYNSVVSADFTMIAADMPGSFFYTRSVEVNSAASPALPELATWAMMILGTGAVGFAMRRRNKGVTTTVKFA